MLEIIIFAFHFINNVLAQTFPITIPTGTIAFAVPLLSNPIFYHLSIICSNSSTVKIINSITAVTGGKRWNKSAKLIRKPCKLMQKIFLRHWIIMPYFIICKKSFRKMRLLLAKEPTQWTLVDRCCWINIQNIGTTNCCWPLCVCTFSPLFLCLHRLDAGTFGTMGVSWLDCFLCFFLVY